jgi:hypothetical protein
MHQIILTSLMVIYSSFANSEEDKRIEILRLALIDLTSSEMDYEIFEKKYMVKAEVPQEIVDFYCTSFEEMLSNVTIKKLVTSSLSYLTEI